MSKDLQHFTLEPELINPEASNTAFSVRANCADITFVNLDTVNTAYVNDYPLGPAAVAGNPGGSITFGANQGEWNDTNFIVKCVQPVGQLGLWVWRKHYTKTLKHEI